MATIVVCNQCGRTLEPTERVGLELRTMAFSSVDTIDELDACADCAREQRARFLASPGLDKIARAVATPLGGHMMPMDRRGG